MKIDWRATWKTAVYIFQTLWRLAPLHFLGLVGISVGFVVFPSLQVWATSELINSVTRNIADGQTGKNIVANIQPYMSWIALLISVFVTKNIVYAATPYLSTLVAERVGEQVEGDVYRKILALPLERFEDVQTFDQAHRALTGVQKLGRFYQNDVQELVFMLFTLSGLLGVFFVQGYWYIALLLLVAAVPFSWWGLKSAQAFVALNYDQSPLQRRLGYWSSLLTTRESAAEVRLYSLQSFLLQRWKQLSARILNETNKMRLGLLWREPLFVFASLSVTGVAVGILLHAVNQRWLSLGLFIALLLTAQQFMQLLGFVGWELQGLGERLGQITYIPQLFEMEEEKLYTSQRKSVTFLHDICFERVSFRYPGSEKLILDETSLRIQVGERIALVGENGAGKSTLIKLLLGLYQPTSGRILIDGVDLKEIDVYLWRAVVGAVFQDFMRYSFTVRDNIGLGNIAEWENAETIKQAAQLSTADDFIADLPAKYETLLGKEFADGQELSYGQWQKLAIARAYIRNAQLLVLDEPASALDARTEYEVYRQFRDIAQGRTVLLISHRLGSARLADRILFLRNGRIQEDGTHEQLLAQQGEYAQLYKLQAEWYQEQQQEEVVHE